MDIPFQSRRVLVWWCDKLNITAFASSVDAIVVMQSNYSCGIVCCLKISWILNVLTIFKRREKLELKTRDIQVKSLFGNDIQCVIPLFQRHYVWDQEGQWEPLWEDLKGKANQRLPERQNQQHMHFTGAIVIQQSLTSTYEVQTYEIIDGQQRLTTFQIILCAIRDVCKSYESDEFKNIEAEADRYVHNQGMLLGSEAEQYKLIPTEFDRSAFISLVDRRPDNSSGRIRETYLYFKGKIEGYVNRDKDKMLAVLRAVLNDFGFVEILLDPLDQPERIFESLNARAKSLRQFDLLRNNLFLRARIEENRDKLYNDYWMHFEDDDWEREVTLGKTKMTLSELFFQHFLIAKLGEENVTPYFSVYQRRLLKNNQTVENELIELHKYSATYRKMTECSPNSEIGRAMSFYETFDIATLHPLLLFLMDGLNVSGTDLTEILNIMESYTMRRLVCFRQGVRSYTKFICKLIQRLRDKPFDLGYFIYLLSAETAKSTQWPTDSEVKTFLTLAWANQSINPKVIRYLLYRIELAKRQKNPFLETEQLDFNNLSLEHIIPVGWKQTWCLPLADDRQRSSDDPIYYKDLFRADYKRMNREWETEPSEEGLVSSSYQDAFQLAQERSLNLQSIGNLTLVTVRLNSKMSNSPFVEKKSALRENSGLRLNKEICAHDDWDTQQIQDRADELFTIFCEIWPSPDEFAKGFPYDLRPPMPVSSQDELLPTDFHPDEIIGGPSPVSLLPIGAAIRGSYPLTVTIPGKDLSISRRTGMETLIEVIGELGIEDVRALGIMSYGIPLVAIRNYAGSQQTPVGSYYIAGNSPTAAKVEQIKTIGRLLKVQLEVDQNNVV